MFLRGDYWQYDFIVGGVRYRGSTGYKSNEKNKAAEVENRLKVEAREGHSIEMVWEQTKRRKLAGHELPLDHAQIWDAFVGTATCRAGAPKQKEYSNNLRFFCDFMRQNYPNIQKISEVLPVHAQKWTSDIRSKPGAPATKNKRLLMVKQIFKALGKNHGIVENPFANISLLPKEEVPREAFTPDELKLIGSKGTGWIYSLCLTAISTGLREGDICKLTKKQVNLDTGYISIHRTRKTGVSVDIPMLPGLHRHVKQMIEDYPDSEYVFPELAKMYNHIRGDISNGVKAFFEDIGITGARKTIPGYKRIVSVKDVHSFRHTFIYLAAVHGIPFPIVQGIVGHLNPEMTKHYMDHAGREAKIQYLRQLPEYITGAKATRPRELTRERVMRMLNRLTPENLTRNKKRIISLLSRG